jgi:hypothetical protein
MSKPGAAEECLATRSLASHARTADTEAGIFQPATAEECLLHESYPLSMAGDERFTYDNIEDWDFRDPDLLEMSDPVASMWFMTYWPDVLAVEAGRLPVIIRLVESGAAELVTRDEGDYVVVKKAPFELKTPEGDSVTVNDASRYMADFLHTGRLRRRTSTGRFEAQVKQSILREWEKHGRLKVSIRPRPDIDEQTRATGAIEGLRGPGAAEQLRHAYGIIMAQHARLDQLRAEKPLHP